MPEHCISGAVYVASESAFYLVDFSYDGRGTGAFFWAGDTSTPDGRGEALPDENGTRSSRTSRSRPAWTTRSRRLWPPMSLAPTTPASRPSWWKTRKL
ncbi:hypothetical protein V5799_013924, partial [Amblyomma americanum]